MEFTTAQDHGITKSTSEGASLGSLLSDSLAVDSSDNSATASASKRKMEPVKEEREDESAPQTKPSEGLFALPEPGSKRQRQSRYMVIDGHAVLKENNYSIDDGFISVFEGGEMRTGEVAHAVSSAQRAEAVTAHAAAAMGTGGFYINSAGKVVNAEDAAAKAARLAERQAKRLAEGPKDTRDPVVVAHRAALKEDSEGSEIKRALFVHQHIDIFRLFVTPAYAKRAEQVAQTYKEACAATARNKSGIIAAAASSSSGGVRSSPNWSSGNATTADERDSLNLASRALTADQKRDLQSEDPAIKAAAQEARRLSEITRTNALTKKAIAEAQQPVKQFSMSDLPGCIDKKVVQMRDYQVEGVNFMLRMYHAGCSCVLADEMGLGKTIQTIAFLGSLKKDLKVKGAHLVVVPMSVLSNWMAEFKKFCPSLKVIRYHSSELSEKQRIRNLVSAGIPSGDVDVVVTTYEMVVSEGKNTGILSSRYRMLVLDEAHKVKNDETQVSAACRRITRENCIFLTGTPVQNNLKECWSLLNCMQPDLFSKSDLFDDAFDANDMSVTNLELVNSVYKLMQLLVLRRRKAQVDLNLPPKREMRLLCPLSKQQTFWYKRVLLMNAQSLISSQYTTNTTIADGSAASAPATAPSSKGSAASTPSTNKLSNLMMQLRKISNHPYLMTGVEREDQITTAQDLSAASGKLRMLDRLLMALKREGHRCVIFSQFTKMLDLIEDFISMRGYTYVRLDGSTNRIQRMINIGRYNAPQSTLFIFLLSTRAGGLGVNLQTADTCILYDSDWNPQCDLQAMARVHRIGQKRPVTIYRMVSAGTVEERIVARATRKLLLDEMVSKGSDDMLKGSSPRDKDGTEKKGKPEVEEDPDEEVHASEMVRALKFTMKKMFKQNGGQTIGLLDDGEGDAMSIKNIDAAIERTRAVSSDSAYANSSVGNMPMEEEEEEEADDDDPMFSMTSNDIKTSDFGGEDFSFASVYKGKTLRDIRNEWEERGQVVEGKRDNKSRLVQVDGGVGMGKVFVLKDNMYDLNEGEPSVFQRESGKGKPAPAPVAAAPVAKKPPAAAGNGAPKVRSNRAGMHYTNFKHCQACGSGGGDMIQCGNCPMSFHVVCIGYKNITQYRQTQKTGIVPDEVVGYYVGTTYFCPHHKCYGCKKKTAEAGNLLVRCIGCPLAFCEDCADWDGALNIVPEQPPHLLQKVGFWKCNQAVYCYCTALCQQVSDETDLAVLGKNHPAVKAVEQRKKQDDLLLGIKRASPAKKPATAPVVKLDANGFPKLTKKQVKIEYKAAADFASLYGHNPSAYAPERLVEWHRQQIILIARNNAAAAAAKAAADAIAGEGGGETNGVSSSSAAPAAYVAAAPAPASTPGPAQAQTQAQAQAHAHAHTQGSSGVGSGYDGVGGNGHGAVQPQADNRFTSGVQTQVQPQAAQTAQTYVQAAQP